MLTAFQKTRPLPDYKNVPFEIFVFVFTVLPFFVLAYFYPALPDRVPVFMKLNGEVEAWAGKSLLSVFRVPLMAVVTQAVCLLMKYGTAQSKAVVPHGLDAARAELRRQYLGLNARLWDWLRLSVAFKMSAESLDEIFLSLERFRFLSRPTFIITAFAALVGAGGALFYVYRLLVVGREMKEKSGDAKAQESLDERRVYGGILYFNPHDPALFAGRHVFNMANKWAWAFIACIIAYPLLVFLPG
jgi:uncharacterized membrane protein